MVLKLILKICLVLILILNEVKLGGQNVSSSSEIRLSLLGYKAENGINATTNYKKGWLISPEIIYSKSMKSGDVWLRGGIGMRMNSKYKYKNKGFVYEEGEVNRYKVIIGIEKRYENKIIDIFYGLDLEYEKSQIKGEMYQDIPPYSRGINHKKNSYSIETNMGLRKEFISKLLIFIETNLVLRVSESRSQKINNEIPNLGPFLDIHYNPINSIGFIYKIK